MLWNEGLLDLRPVEGAESFVLMSTAADVIVHVAASTQGDLVRAESMVEGSSVRGQAVSVSRGRNWKKGQH